MSVLPPTDLNIAVLQCMEYLCRHDRERYHLFWKSSCEETAAQQRSRFWLHVRLIAWRFPPISPSMRSAQLALARYEDFEQARAACESDRRNPAAIGSKPEEDLEL